MKLRTDNKKDSAPGYIYLFESERRVSDYRKSKLPALFGVFPYKCDFHVHTTLSDGALTPRERVDEALAEGIDVIALTDHTPFMWGDYIARDEAYNDAAEYARKNGIRVVKGVELTCSKPVGHWGMLFLDNVDEYKVESYPMPIADVRPLIDKVRLEDGVVVYNHPGWPDHDTRFASIQEELIDAGLIDAVEVVSLHEFYPGVIDTAHGCGLSLLSVTDLHRTAAEEFDLCRRERNYTIVYSKSDSDVDLKDAVRKGRTIAVSGDLLVSTVDIMREFLKESLSIIPRRISETQYIITITNITPYRFVFRGSHNQHFSIPSCGKVDIYLGNVDLGDSFFVENVYVGSGEKMETNLCSLFGLNVLHIRRSVNTDALNLPSDGYMCHLFRGDFTSIDSIEQNRAECSLSVYSKEASSDVFADIERYGALYERTYSVDSDSKVVIRFFTDGLVRLYVNHHLVLCNDSMCRITNGELRIPLCKGWHLFQLYYVQDFRGEHFKFEISENSCCLNGH